MDVCVCVTDAVCARERERDRECVEEKRRGRDIVRSHACKREKERVCGVCVRDKCGVCV